MNLRQSGYVICTMRLPFASLLYDEVTCHARIASARLTCPARRQSRACHLMPSSPGYYPAMKARLPAPFIGVYSGGHRLDIASDQVIHRDQPERSQFSGLYCDSGLWRTDSCNLTLETLSTDDGSAGSCETFIV